MYSLTGPGIKHPKSVVDTISKFISSNENVWTYDKIN